jgi:protein-disulfide isomerase
MAKKKSTATRRAGSQAASARAAAIRKEQERKERRRQTLVVTAVGVVVLAIIVLVVTRLSSSKDTTGATGAAPKGVVAGYAVPSGSSSAPVKVTVYEDFICPYCGQFEAASRTAFQKDIDAGKVQFQYHVLNFLDGNSTTRYSTRSANALAVVLNSAGPTAAKKFHDLLFENQPQERTAGLTDSQLVDFAVQSGAKKSAVQSGIDDLTFEPWVKKVTDKASKDGVTGTPTVSINGKTLNYSTTEELVTKVEQAIAKGGS